MNKINRVSIVGLGWLGMPLALSLSASGYQVSGTKTMLDGVDAAKLSGINCFQLYFSPNPECDIDKFEQLLQSDVLIITLPAGRSAEQCERYRLSVQCLVDSALAHRIPRIIFISSTSIYGRNEGIVNEDSALDPETEAGKTLLALEYWLHDLPHTQVDILRLAGLIGFDRHPGRFLSGKTGIAGGECGVNLVHQDDVINAIKLLLAQPKGNHCYNLCAPEHPRKRDFYPAMARQLDMAEPTFIEINKIGLGRIIDGNRICQELGFEYQYPNPALIPLNLLV